MRQNLENLVIVFAFAAAVATLAWFGYRALSGHDERAETVEEARPGAPVDEALPPEGSGGEEPPQPIEAAEPGGPGFDETAPEQARAPEEDGPEETSPALEEEESSASLSLSLLRDRVAESTVIVESAATGRALGAGFVVAPGLVATSAAVAERSDGARARLLDADSATPVDGVARIDGDSGVALLEVPGLDAPALGAAGEVNVALGDRVYALAGSAVGAGVSEGLVGSLRRIGGARAFTISVPIAAAVEGGPVVDAEGSLLGVAIRRVGEEGLEEVAIGAGALRDLASREPEEAPTEAPRPTVPPEPAPTRRVAPEGAGRPAPRAPQPEPARPALPEPGADAYERRFDPRDYVVTSAAKLHERPDASSHVIARLRRDTVVTAVGEIEGWLRIRSTTGRRDGYLRAEATRALRRR